MTKEAFEQGYCERSNLSREYYRQLFVTLPCACGSEECGGWAAVRNEPNMIKDHIELYSPKEKD